MGTTPVVQRLSKVLGWLGSAAGGAAAGSAAGLAITFSISGLHLLNSIILGQGNNQSRDIQGNGNFNSSKSGDTNVYTGNTLNFKVDNSTHYKEGDVINLRVIKVNPNNHSITVHSETLTKEENNITNNQRQSSATVDNQTVSNFFSECNCNPGGGLGLLTPPPSNTSWSFPPSANLSERSGGFGLNPLGSPTFLSPAAGTVMVENTDDNDTSAPQLYDDLISIPSESHSVSEPFTIFGSVTALGAGAVLKQEYSKRLKKAKSKPSSTTITKTP